MLKISKGNNKYSQYQEPPNPKLRTTTKKLLKKEPRNGRPHLYLDPAKQIEMYKNGYDPFSNTKIEGPKKKKPRGTFQKSGAAHYPNHHWDKQSSKIRTLKHPQEIEPVRTGDQIKLGNYKKNGSIKHPN
jgi:hypothetical protein